MKNNTRSLLCCLLMLISCGNAFGFVFGEHKEIGDSAFIRFINSDPIIRSFFSKVLFNSDDNCPMIINGNDYVIMPKDPMIGGITYGDMTGMLADHAFDPIELFQEIIKSDTSKWSMGAPDQNVKTNNKGNNLAQVLLLHHYAIEEGKKAASDIKLQLIQPDYAALATEDSSHFYRLGLRTVQDQLHIGAEQYLHVLSLGNSKLGYFAAKFAVFHLDKQGNIGYKFNFPLLVRLFSEMHGLNAISKYAVLHTIALEMMDASAANVNANGSKLTDDARFTVLLALLFNANADHYLQDAFAAGHLAVDRSVPRAMKNKGAHDYYNRIGFTVSNEKGKTWFSHGDGFLSDTSINFNYAVEANTASLNELWERYNSDINNKTPARIASGGQNTSIVAQLSGHSTDSIINYFWDNYAGLKIIPRPLDPAIVKYTHSRNGNYLTATANYTNENKLYQIGAYYGVYGFNLIQPKKPVKWRESNVWISLINFGATYNSTPNNWALSASVIEANFYNLITIGAGSFYHSFTSRARIVEYAPYAGLEYRAISSAFSPAFRYTLPVNSDQKGFFSFQLRYYFK